MEKGWVGCPLRKGTSKAITFGHFLNKFLILCYVSCKPSRGHPFYSRRQRRRRYRKQKRGLSVGNIREAKRRPHTPPLPSMLLSNARSIVNKIDELNLWISSEKLITDCCILVITETLLHSLVPDATMELTSRTLFHWDRNTNSGKRKGGGLCIYVHNSWCTNAQILTQTVSLI